MTPADRRRGLTAAICCVAVFGLSIGQGAPLLSLLLETRHVDALMNGLNAGSAFIGVLLGPLLAPRIVRVTGLRPMLLGCLVLDIAAFMMMRVFDGLGAWFMLRIAAGLVGSSLFTLSEAWITMLAGDTARGRILGIYAAGLSAGFGLGPLLLYFTGIVGWTPFVVNAVITAAAAIPLLGIGAAAEGFGRERAANPLAMFARAPFLLFAIVVFGLYETALLTLLPVWGVRIHLPQGTAAAMISAVYIGAIFGQMLVGTVSDKVGRNPALLLCVCTGLLGAVVVPLAAGSTLLLFAVLFVWGGIASGIYPVALGMAGDRYTGAELVALNAAIIIAYGIGSLIGPTLAGAAMDAWNPRGLLGYFAALFAMLLLITMARSATRR